MSKPEIFPVERGRYLQNELHDENACTSTPVCDYMEIFEQELPDPNMELFVQGVQGLKEFTLFPKLAPELRLLIWRFASYHPREVKMRRVLKPSHRTMFWSCATLAPSILGANRESREIGLEHYKILMTYGNMGVTKYVNPEVDLLVLENCSKSGNTPHVQPSIRNMIQHIEAQFTMQGHPGTHSIDELRSWIKSLGVKSLRSYILGVYNRSEQEGRRGPSRGSDRGLPPPRLPTTATAPPAPCGSNGLSIPLRTLVATYAPTPLAAPGNTAPIPVRGQSLMTNLHSFMVPPWERDVPFLDSEKANSYVQAVQQLLCDIYTEDDEFKDAYTPTVYLSDRVSLFEERHRERYRLEEDRVRRRKEERLTNLHRSQAWRLRQRDVNSNEV